MFFYDVAYIVLHVYVCFITSGRYRDLRVRDPRVRMPNARRMAWGNLLDLPLGSGSGPTAIQEVSIVQMVSCV